jgi:hypothetical protein
MSEKKTKTTQTKAAKPAKTTSSSSKFEDGDVFLRYKVSVDIGSGEEIDITGEVNIPYLISKAELSTAEDKFNQVYALLVSGPLQTKFKQLVNKELEKHFPQQQGGMMQDGDTNWTRPTLPAPELSENDSDVQEIEPV